MADASADLTGTGVWCGGLRWGDPAEAVDAAAELDELGYTALWIPDVGGDVFGAVDRLLVATSHVTVATGVLNLWKHTAEETAAGYHKVVREHGQRVLVGIGVSHATIVDTDESRRYERPLEAMQSFLDGLDAAPNPLPRNARALAALGPKMLTLARNGAAGVHPYNVTPEHTALAREAIGPDALVLPEQAVALVRDKHRGRELGRQFLANYFTMPNYVNNWRRLGFDDDDFAAGGSDRFVDAIVAWGDETALATRVSEHFAAGANHVCVQVLLERGWFPRDVWRSLAPVLVQGLPTQSP